MASLSRRAEDCKKASLVIWAGDMVERGRVEALRPVLEATQRKCPRAQIVAVFGNEEYMDREHEFARAYDNVVWLNDSYIVVEEKGKSIAIYGSRGALDRPTRWQRRNIPGIETIYKRRAERMKTVLSRLRNRTDIVIVVTHYAPTYLTLEGEKQEIWPELGSRAVEKALLKARPDIAIHGHAHNSRRLEAMLDGIRVLNVAFPARKDVTIVKL